MNRILCSICDSSLTHLYELNNYPIKFSTSDIPLCDTSILSFSQCSTCNTIQLDKLIPLNILYSDNHNYISVGKTWTEYFNTICNKLHPIVDGKIILEIGDPSGKIANKLSNYSKWYILEPNKNKNVVFNENIEFIEDFFGESSYELMKDKSIDVIVHSHLFEHIYQPIEFLKNCRRILNDDGVMCFGIPNMEHIAEKNICPFIGLGFEHTIFLNEDNVKYMLEITGFTIIDIVYYEKHSVIYHCIKSNAQPNICKICDYKQNFVDTIEKYKEFTSYCNSIIDENPDKRVYVFGASYYTQALFYLGLNNKNVHGILDNCLEKQGKYFYGFNIKIYDPSIIKTESCIIILKNGYYTNEIILQLESNQYLSKDSILIK